MNGRTPRFGSRSRPARARTPGFVLLEVILAITIMTFAIGAALRSFSQSLAAVRIMEVKSKAQYFAQQLLDEYELQPPVEGEYEGGFGDDFWEYTYRVEIQYEEQDYDSTARSSDIDRYVPMRLLSIEIVFDNGVHEPFVAATLKSAILGFEKFSQEARRQFQEY